MKPPHENCRPTLSPIDLPDHQSWRTYCRLTSVQPTPLRRLVLRILYEAGTPLSASDITTRAAAASGRPAYPQSVYRSLEWLRDRRVILPVTTIAKYMIAPDPSMRFCVLMCASCGRVATTPLADAEAFRRLCEKHDFLPSRAYFEIIGRCARC